MAWFDSTEWERQAFAAVPPRLWPEGLAWRDVRRVALTTNWTRDVHVVLLLSAGQREAHHGYRVEQVSPHNSGGWLPVGAGRIIPKFNLKDEPFEGAVRTLAAWLNAVGVEVTTDERPLREILETPR